MIKVVYEDRFIYILDKPPGLVVTPSETLNTKTLSDILQKDFGVGVDRGGVVHRLDKDTSGLIIIARDPHSFENLQSQFKNRQVRKEYTALVHGLVSRPGEINAPIARNTFNREKFMVTSDGREALTRYEPVRSLQLTDDSLQVLFGDFSKIQLKKLYTQRYTLFTLLKCFPKTGRTHQIRVHLKHTNHPIVADEKYGGRKISRMDRRWCPRQFLHASKIEFLHPNSGDKMVFESSLPEDLQMALDFLE